MARFISEPDIPDTKPSGKAFLLIDLPPNDIQLLAAACTVRDKGNDYYIAESDGINQKWFDTVSTTVDTILINNNKLITLLNLDIGKTVTLPDNTTVLEYLLKQEDL